MSDRYDPNVPIGGHARASGGCYHLSFRSGSRAGGASGAAAFDYVTRSREYDDEDRDPAIYTESDHMPSWAADDPREYWDAADLYERANGRLYVSADFALPLDLDRDEQIALAREFARELTEGERLPYTLAIHAGRDEDGQEHNPHAHLMFSERRNDGIERSREQWFRRADSQRPERGGAPKSRAFHGRKWVEQAREKWAESTNKTLERAGRSERVDHRSYARQGIHKEPGEHYGPAAPHFLSRGDAHERLDDALAVGDRERVVGDIDLEIAQLEAARESVLREAALEGRTDTPRESDSSGAGRDNDQSWGR